MASVRKRRWQKAGQEKEAWVVDYHDQYGKRRLKTFVRKKEADAFLVSAQHEVSQGIHAPGSASISVARVAEDWLTAKEHEGLEPHTLRSYRSQVSHHVAPLVGHEKLANLTRPKIEAVKEELLRTRSRATARSAIQTIRTILSYAQANGFVAQNVAVNVRVKELSRHKRKLRIGTDIPSREEIRKILSLAEGRWRPLLVTAVFTGMRASELRGLTWSNVDFETKRIHVTQRADERNVIGPPKSPAGWREIPMTLVVENTLKEWKLGCPAGDLNLVFPNTVGRVERLPNIHRRCLTPIQIQARIVNEQGRQKYGMHALRHFFASWLIQGEEEGGLGFSPKRAQAILGHQSIQMTFDTYGHLFPREDVHQKMAAGETAILGEATAS
jgi:integrase